MKLPVIKHLNTFIENNDEDYVVEAIVGRSYRGEFFER